MFHIRSLRNEGLLVLEGRGRILETARDITPVIGDAGLPAAIIGGVAVVLHGYVRTTADVDVLVSGAAKPLAEALRSAGCEFHRNRRELVRETVPVRLVTGDEVGIPPAEFVEIDRPLSACSTCSTRSSIRACAIPFGPSTRPTSST